jgi:hypothetical protein
MRNCHSASVFNREVVKLIKILLVSRLNLRYTRPSRAGTAKFKDSLNCWMVSFQYSFYPSIRKILDPPIDPFLKGLLFCLMSEENALNLAFNQ